MQSSHAALTARIESECAQVRHSVLGVVDDVFQHGDRRSGSKSAASGCTLQVVYPRYALAGNGLSDRRTRSASTSGVNGFSKNPANCGAWRICTGSDSAS